MNKCCGPKEAEKFIIFRQGLDTGEALVLRSVLEGAGITVWLSNEHMASLNYAVSADLMIRENDRYRADQIMQEVSMFPSEAKRMNAADTDQCQHCGSTHVFNYVGDVPTWGGFRKTRAFPGSPWRKCLQCKGFFRTDSRRILGNLPLALLWGGALAGFIYFLNYAIAWLKVML